jgi:hypothetical protein
MEGFRPVRFHCIDALALYVQSWDSLARSGHALLTHKPAGQKYVSVIRMMARDVAFFGRASGRARRTSVVNRYDGLESEKLSFKRNRQSGMLLGMELGPSTIPQNGESRCLIM